MATQIPQLIGRSSAGAAATATTPAMNTTGATLLVVAVSVSASVAPSIVSDSKSNTWTALTPKAVTGNQSTQLFYAANPTVGATHTFTATLTSGSPGLVALAFSGVTITSPFDQQNGTSGSTSSATIQPGSITPGSNGELVITAMGQGASLTTDGQINLDDLSASIFSFVGILSVGGTSWGVWVGWAVQTTAAAINPTWKLVQGTGTNSNLTAVIASFKAATAASAGGQKGFASA